MIVLSKEQVLMLHHRLAEITGGSEGIRDDGMLDSAISNPFQCFDGESLYPGILNEGDTYKTDLTAWVKMKLQLKIKSGENIYMVYIANESKL